jgi:enoyl-CoA hydratase/carnithine racemase
MTDPSHLLVDRQGPIVTVTLNRPDQRNALSRPLMLELTEVLQQIGNSDARGVILAANGPVMSAGQSEGKAAQRHHFNTRHPPIA